MKKKLVVAVIVVIILGLGFYLALNISSGKGALNQEIGRNPGNTLYSIVAELNAKDKTLKAVQKVSYVNNEEVALNEIYFHLYPNAFKRKETTPVLFEEYERAYKNGFAPGSVKLYRVNRLDVNDTKPLKYSISGEDETILNIELGGLILPGQTVTLEMEYEVAIPPAFERFGYGDTHFNLGNWYPIAAVYDKQGWNIDRYYPIGDPFYSDVADYEVTIKAPSELIIAAPGKLLEKKQQSDYSVWSFGAYSIRDFAFVANSQFQVSEKLVDGVWIRSYYYIGDEFRGKEALILAEKAITTFNQAFGKYPYQYYSVVETEFPSGMEYPGLVYINKDYYKLDNSYEYFAYTIVHETAHQWWYAAVGSDQVDEAWLDEGLTTYSEAIFTEKQYGDAALREYVGYFRETTDNAIATVSFDGVVLKPLSKFKSWEDYGPAVYDMGAMVVSNLRDMVGDKLFFDIMRAYFEEYKFKNASTEDFIAVCERVSKRDLQDYFRSMLNGI